MNWNKSNTILIIAFLIVNVFLFSYTYYGDYVKQKQQVVEEKEFALSVNELLEENKISVKCDIPIKTYKKPFLEIEYETVKPNISLIQMYLPKFNGQVKDDILSYECDGDKFEILGGKKIIYSKETSQKNVSKNEIKSQKNVDNIINEFCKDKDIDLDKFEKDIEVEQDNGQKYIRYVQMYNGFKLENSYLNFYIDNGNIVKFEKQLIANIHERANVKVISANDALLRLIAKGIKNADVTKIELCYYTKENENFEVINSINVDLVWKATLNNKKYVYLESSDY